MRYVMLVKANEQSEAGEMPSEGEFTEMNRYNEELAKAGVMLAGEGLHPSAKGSRIRFSKTGRTVTDGPFPETKELIAGFWLIHVKSHEEAVEWAKRVPFQEGEVELRRVFDAEDFGDALPPEVKEAEERLAAQMEENKKR